jgi:hypothetical protein
MNIPLLCGLQFARCHLKPEVVISFHNHITLVSYILSSVRAPSLNISETMIITAIILVPCITSETERGGGEGNTTVKNIARSSGELAAYPLVMTKS